jgi:electron transfer flavoprotein beta subunit
MNIVVCVKTVPNPALPVEFDVNKGTFIDDEWNYILNPYDEAALEKALCLKEKYGGRVTVITADTARSEEALRKCLSLGADNAIRVDTHGLSLFDSLTIAKTLFRLISRMPYDIILCGDQSSDQNCGEVGSMLAELLNLPVVTSVTQMEIDINDNSVTVSRKLEKGARERKRCYLPALFTTDLMLNEPRYPTLPGRKKAGKQEIRIIDINSPDGIQAISAPDAQHTRLLSVNRPPPKKIFIPTGDISPAERIRLLTQGTAAKKSSGNILEGNPEEIAKKVTAFLKEKHLIPERTVSPS